MQLTNEQIEQLARSTCPHCKAGIAVRLRTDTGEWVHDSVKTSVGVVNGHSICWASGLRAEYGNG